MLPIETSLPSAVPSHSPRGEVSHTTHTHPDTGIEAARWARFIPQRIPTSTALPLHGSEVAAGGSVRATIRPRCAPAPCPPHRIPAPRALRIAFPPPCPAHRIPAPCPAYRIPSVPAPLHPTPYPPRPPEQTWRGAARSPQHSTAVVKHKDVVAPPDFVVSSYEAARSRQAAASASSADCGALGSAEEGGSSRVGAPVREAGRSQPRGSGAAGGGGRRRTLLFLSGTRAQSAPWYSQGVRQAFWSYLHANRTTATERATEQRGKETGKGGKGGGRSGRVGDVAGEDAERDGWEDVVFKEGKWSIDEMRDAQAPIEHIEHTLAHGVYMSMGMRAHRCNTDVDIDMHKICIWPHVHLRTRGMPL